MRCVYLERSCNGHVIHVNERLWILTPLTNVCGFSRHRDAQVAAAAKAARQQQKEEEAKLEEEERQAKECMHRSFESELEKCAVRVTQLGQDRDKRDYWLFGGKEWRVYVRDRGVVSRRRPAYLGDDGVPTEGGVNEEEGSRGLELWGFYDQPEQVQLACRMCIHCVFETGPTACRRPRFSREPFLGFLGPGR